MIHDLGPIAELSQTKITNEVPADVEIYSETRLLEQVIQNLLSNAVKLTPQGTVTVGARTGRGRIRDMLGYRYWQGNRSRHSGEGFREIRNQWITRATRYWARAAYSEGDRRTP